MNVFLTLACLFFIGSVAGWVIELLFRNIVHHNKKWVNPGFCTGPYLPIYGFGLCVLYLLASLEKFSLISDPLWNKVVLFIAMAIGMTLVELENIDGSITLDTPLQEAYKGLDSLNSAMNGDFPLLQAGTNAVSWTGNVSRVEIRPNWRFLV